MLRTIGNAFRVPEIQRKLLFTAAMLGVSIVKTRVVERRRRLTQMNAEKRRSKERVR